MTTTTIDPTLNQVDVGIVSRVDEYENAYVVLMSEDGADYELGFTIYKDQYTNFPDKVESIAQGSKIAITGLGSSVGVRRLIVDDVEWFQYTPQQAALIKKIRKCALTIQLAQNELGKLP